MKPEQDGQSDKVRKTPRGRAEKACVRCRAKKRTCDGGNPCQRCKESHSACYFRSVAAFTSFLTDSDAKSQTATGTILFPIRESMSNIWKSSRSSYQRV